MHNGSVLTQQTGTGNQVEVCHSEYARLAVQKGVARTTPIIAVYIKRNDGKPVCCN
jgi:hypothetical protein